MQLQSLQSAILILSQWLGCGLWASARSWLRRSCKELIWHRSRRNMLKGNHPILSLYFLFGDVFYGIVLFHSDQSGGLPLHGDSARLLHLPQGDCLRSSGKKRKRIKQLLFYQLNFLLKLFVYNFDIWWALSGTNSILRTFLCGTIWKNHPVSQDLYMQTSTYNFLHDMWFVEATDWVAYFELGRSLKGFDHPKVRSVVAEEEVKAVLAAAHPGSHLHCSNKKLFTIHDKAYVWTRNMCKKSWKFWKTLKPSTFFQPVSIYGPSAYNLYILFAKHFLQHFNRQPSYLGRKFFISNYVRICDAVVQNCVVEFNRHFWSELGGHPLRTTRPDYSAFAFPQNLRRSVSPSSNTLVGSQVATVYFFTNFNIIVICGSLWGREWLNVFYAFLCFFLHAIFFNRFVFYVFLCFFAVFFFVERFIFLAPFLCAVVFFRFFNVHFTRFFSFFRG